MAYSARGCRITPASYAKTTAWTRSRRSSFERIRATCVLTVAPLRTSVSAISAVLFEFRMRLQICANTRRQSEVLVGYLPVYSNCRSWTNRVLSVCRNERLSGLDCLANALSSVQERADPSVSERQSHVTSVLEAGTGGPCSLISPVRGSLRRVLEPPRASSSPTGRGWGTGKCGSRPWRH